LPQIFKTYVETGKVRYVFRNFPLSSIHPQSQRAAEATECAGEQGQYWEMHDALFKNQAQWSGKPNAEEIFKKLAGDLGVDEAQFDACFSGSKYADRIAADQQEGLQVGVTGTPGFRISGAALSGAQPFSEFARVIDYFLAGGEPPALEVAADSFRSVGRADAPVVVTAFCDYQYPACGAFGLEVIPELVAQYADTGKARVVYREYPLSPATQQAAEAAMCAGQQDQYWEMNEKLFATRDDWGAQEADLFSFFSTYAEELGLDTAAFNECLDSEDTAMAVQGDKMAGEAVGVNTMPYAFINDLSIRGATPASTLGQVIDYVAAGGETPEIVPKGEDWHVWGNKETAKAITIAFVDYASPESGQHARDVLPQLAETYIDQGQLLYVLQPWSEADDNLSAQAAGAAECAGQQGKFWEMHDRLFDKQETWTEAAEPQSLFSSYAQALGLDTGQFETCLDSEWVKLRVQAGSIVATLYGVPGAPVFLFNNGQGQQGSPTFDEFETIIGSILNQ